MSFSKSLQQTIAEMEAAGVQSSPMGDLVKQLSQSISATDAQLDAMRAAAKKHQ
jgi:hypothetical protein